MNLRLRSKLKRLLEHLTGMYLYRVLPRGIDYVFDLKKDLPNLCVNTVFDVGANVGQSAEVFLKRFPESHIFCFEPVTNNFSLLKKNMRDNRRVNCHQIAFGSYKRAGKMILQGMCEMFFLQGQSPVLADKDQNTETVNVDTLDSFCRQSRIDNISFLKIDTEGGDLDVLKGAVSMLDDQKIDVIQVEAGMNPGNTRHVSFEAIKGFLQSHGYYLFGIYEQVSEGFSQEPHLRRTNPIFISKQVIRKNRNSA